MPEVSDPPQILDGGTPAHQVAKLLYDEVETLGIEQALQIAAQVIGLLASTDALPNEVDLGERLRAAESDAFLWKAIAQRNDGEVRRVVSENNPTFALKSSAMSIVAATCRDFIDSVPEALNYCSLGFEDDKGRLELVIQRPEGESPATRAERLAAELQAVSEALGWYSWKCGFMVPIPRDGGGVITDERRLSALVGAHAHAKTIGDVPGA